MGWDFLLAKELAAALLERQETELETESVPWSGIWLAQESTLDCGSLVSRERFVQRRTRRVSVFLHLNKVTNKKASTTYLGVW